MTKQQQRARVLELGKMEISAFAAEMDAMETSEIITLASLLIRLPAKVSRAHAIRSLHQAATRVAGHQLSLR